MSTEPRPPQAWGKADLPSADQYRLLCELQTSQQQHGMGVARAALLAGGTARLTLDSLLRRRWAWANHGTPNRISITSGGEAAITAKLYHHGDPDELW